MQGSESANKRLEQSASASLRRLLRRGVIGSDGGKHAIIRG
jgi:hypothetical protein